MHHSGYMVRILQTELMVEIYLVGAIGKVLLMKFS